MSQSILVLIAAVVALPNWQTSKQNSPQKIAATSLVGEGWNAAGNSIESRKAKAKASCALTLPQKARIELLVSSVSGLPAFEFGFGDARVPLTIETWDDTLVGLCGEEFIELGLVTMPNQWLGMGLDQQKKELTFFDQDGKSLGTLKGFTEIAKPNLTVSNCGAHLAVENLRVSDWDGQPFRRTREKRLIYEGPDGGRGWTFSPANVGKGQLSTWSSVPGGGITSTSSGSAFRPIKKLPRNFELRLGLAGLGRDKLLSEQANLKLGWYSTPFTEHDSFSFFMSKGLFRVGKLFRESGSTVEFPESQQAGVLLRIFVKYLQDEKRNEYSIRTANGRQLVEIKGGPIRGIPPKAGLAISPSSRLVISSIQILEWDGEAEPEVIPGG